MAGRSRRNRWEQIAPQASRSYRHPQVHPDKCDHPRAADAFNAADVAAKILRVRGPSSHLICSLAAEHHSTVFLPDPYDGVLSRRRRISPRCAIPSRTSFISLSEARGLRSGPDADNSLHEVLSGRSRCILPGWPPAVLLGGATLRPSAPAPAEQKTSRVPIPVISRRGPTAPGIPPVEALRGGPAVPGVQDEGQRRKLDAALEDRQLRREAAAQAEDLERARQWRIVKGGPPLTPLPPGGPSMAVLRRTWGRVAVAAVQECPAQEEGFCRRHSAGVR